MLAAMRLASSRVSPLATTIVTMICQPARSLVPNAQASFGWNKGTSAVEPGPTILLSVTGPARWVQNADAAHLGINSRLAVGAARALLICPTSTHGGGRAG